MRPGGATRLIALLLCLGMVVGFAATYLLSAGVSGWVVLVAAILVLGVPIGAAMRARSRGPGPD